MFVTDHIQKWEVLLVDDEKDNLDVAKQILEFYGALVITASDGMEALEKLTESIPTLLVSDLSMPNLDGWELLLRVRQNPDWATLPIIALTAHAMIGDREKALEAGFDQYISKPFRIQSFLSDLEDCLLRLEATKLAVLRLEGD